MAENRKSVKFQVRRGPEADLPTLAAGEPGLTTDTKKVFFGTGSENIELAKKGDIGGSAGVQNVKNYSNLIPNNTDPESEWDWALALNFAIAQAVAEKQDTVEIRGSKVHTIKSPILIKQGISLVFASNTKIRVVGNFRVFELELDASLSGGVIDIVDPLFDKEVVYLDGKNYWYQWNKTVVKDLSITNVSGQLKGTALHLFSGTKSWECISFVNFDNIRIRNFDKAVHLKAVNPTDGKDVYVNANRFNNFSIENCFHHFVIEGKKSTPYECSGNVFTNFQIQLTDKSLTAIQVTGQDNIFDGFIWDTHRLSHTNPIIELKTESLLTRLFTNLTVNEWVKDEGEFNSYSSARDDVTKGESILPHDPTKHFMAGDQDNVIVNADKLYTVTQVSGPTRVGNQLSALFDLLRESWCGWDNTTEAAPLVLEIDFGTTPISYFKTAGFVCSGAESPKYVKFEFVTSNGGNYTLTETFSQNTLSALQTYRAKAVNIFKMRVTMYGSNSSTNRIKLTRLFMGAGQTRGNAWLSTQGGKVFGEIEFGRSQDGLVWRAPDGSRYRETIDNSGARIMQKL